MTSSCKTSVRILSHLFSASKIAGDELAGASGQASANHSSRERPVARRTGRQEGIALVFADVLDLFPVLVERSLFVEIGAVVEVVAFHAFLACLGEWQSHRVA